MGAVSSVGAAVESGCPHGRGHPGVWCFEQGTLWVPGNAGAALASISLPGPAFWEGLNGFHAKTCRAVVFLDLQAVFIAEGQPAETWGHRDLARTQVGAHQAGGRQHRLSHGCKSGGDPLVGGEPGASWHWFWQQASAHGCCLPPSPLVTDLCGITLLIKASYPVCQSRFIKKLYSAPARLCICKWGDAQALIETSRGSSARDPRESPILGGEQGVLEEPEGASGGGRVPATSWGPAAPVSTRGLGRSHGAV